MEKQPTIAEMRKALEASISAMPPIEHFRRMVASGVINARGEVTRGSRRLCRKPLPWPVFSPFKRDSLVVFQNRSAKIAPFSQSLR